MAKKTPALGVVYEVMLDPATGRWNVTSGAHPRER